MSGEKAGVACADCSEAGDERREEVQAVARRAE